MYADDICLMAPSPAAEQKLIIFVMILLYRTIYVLALLSL